MIGKMNEFNDRGVTQIIKAWIETKMKI